MRNTKVLSAESHAIARGRRPSEALTLATRSHRPTATRATIGVWIMCRVNHQRGPGYPRAWNFGSYDSGLERYWYMPGFLVKPAGWYSSMAMSVAGATNRQIHHRTFLTASFTTAPPLLRSRRLLRNLGDWYSKLAIV